MARLLLQSKLVVGRSIVDSPLARETLRTAGAAYGTGVLIAALATFATLDEAHIGGTLALLLVPIIVVLASVAVRSGATTIRIVRSWHLRANVGRALAVLAPEYRLLARDVSSPGGEGHVAIGRNGVFVILARADGGRVTASSHRLFVNARLPWRDLVDDCRVDALRVRERVRRALGREIPVHAVLCFARAVVAVGQEIQGVKVVHVGRVARLIASAATATPLAASEVAKISATLESLDTPAPVPTRRLAPSRRLVTPARRLALVGRGSARSREMPSAP